VVLAAFIMQSPRERKTVLQPIVGQILDNRITQLVDLPRQSKAVVLVRIRRPLSSGTDGDHKGRRPPRFST
jgi:hypothetical protein